jgi:asparagine synthase (glutamine-hydrolysing)
MIFGTLGAGPASHAPEDYLADWDLGGDAEAVDLALEPEFIVGVTSTGRPFIDRGLFTYRDHETGVTVAGRAEIFNQKELCRSLGLSAGLPLGRLLAEGYRRRGSSVFAELNGSFAIAACDPDRGRFSLARDHLGVAPVFYVVESGYQVHFSDSLRRLRAYAEVEAELDPTVVLRYLLLRYNPGFETLFRGIRKLRPGHALEWKDGQVREEPYWRLSYRSPLSRSDAEHAERLGELIREAVRIRLGAEHESAGAYLSGGMDSSSVVSIMGSTLPNPFHTFSFRCRGESFDESAYARFVSRKWGTKHHEVPFEADQAVAIADLVRLQQEPLSDVGIEVSSYVLAREAEGVVDYVLTGDGGDELFAGHPVYLADRLARWYTLIPSPLRRPLSAALQSLPDRREKKSRLIKAQRFAYSVDFPADLHSNRWRISYKSSELESLLSPEWLSAANEGEDPLRPLRVIYEEADGHDFLSRTLYGDYFTVVDFYLRRMEVLERLGIAARFPLLDRPLVEYAARIPSDLKITSDSATKHLLKAAVSDLLPDEVLNRRDKLGNSVPLKNWLRDSPELQEFVREILSVDAIRRRGIFSPSYVERMWERHLSGRENHSHRIWSLLVLELWCRHNLDALGVPAGSRPVAR